MPGSLELYTPIDHLLRVDVLTRVWGLGTVIQWLTEFRPMMPFACVNRQAGILKSSVLSTWFIHSLLIFPAQANNDMMVHPSGRRADILYIVWKFPPVVWMILIFCHPWRDHSGCDKEEVSLLTSLFSYRFHRGVPLGWIRKGDASSATCHRIFELDYKIVVTRLLCRGTRFLNYECSIKSKFNWTLCWLIHHHRLTSDSNKPSMRT